MKKKFKTINKMPTRKLWASTIAGVAAVAVAIGTVFGLDLDPANVEEALFGLMTFVVFVMQIVQYFTRPGENDGVVEDK